MEVLGCATLNIRLNLVPTRNPSDCPDHLDGPQGSLIIARYHMYLGILCILITGIN